MNDNLTPSLSRTLASIPHEAIGPASKRAHINDRDQAAIELAAYVVAMLKFYPSDMAHHRAELLKRANKVRRSQGNGEIVFVTETTEAIVAATKPDAKAAFEATEARLALLMTEQRP
jgi:hypothetical protein